MKRCCIFCLIAQLIILVTSSTFTKDRYSIYAIGVAQETRILSSQLYITESWLPNSCLP